MTQSNVVQFPLARNTVLHSSFRKRGCGKRDSIRELAHPLLDRVESAPPGFQELFMLRLEIMVNEFEMDVEKFAPLD